MIRNLSEASSEIETLRSASENRRSAVAGVMLWGTAAVVLVFDQLTKYWAVKTLAAVLPDGELVPSRTIVLIEDFLELTIRPNEGGAFGLMSSHPQLLKGLSVIALGIIIWWARSIPPGHRFTRLGFGLVLGGAVGNLLDRLFRGDLIVNTYVADFIHVHWRDRFDWPTFNVADSAICVGIAVILAANLLAREPLAEPEPAAAPAAAASEKPAASRKTTH